MELEKGMTDFADRPECDFGGVVECTGCRNIVREEVSHRAGGKPYCIRCYSALGQERCTHCRRIFVIANGVKVIDGQDGPTHLFCGDVCRVLYYSDGGVL